MSAQMQAPLKVSLSKPVGTLAAVGGGLLIAISLLGFSCAYFVARAVHRALLEEGGELQGREFGATLLLGLGGIALLGFFVVGLGECIAGVRRLLRPELEVPGPEPFRDYQGEVTSALAEGILKVYGSLSGRLRLLFGKNIVSLPPVSHKIVARNGNSIFRRVFTIPTLVFVLAIMYFQGAGLALMFPFVLLVVAGFVQTAVEYCFSKALVAERPAEANVDHASRHYKGFGHPTHLFSRLPISASQLALPGYPNRVYKWGETEKPGVVRDTGEFSATLFIERQPQVLDTESSAAGKWLVATGWAWRLLSAALLVFVFTPAGGWVTTSGPGTVLLVAAVSRLFHKGSVYKRQGVSLLDSLRFSSIGALLNVQGEISRANVKIGGNSVDSVGSETLATRSNFTVQLSAAELLSEAVAVDESRHLLQLRRSDASEQWTSEILEGIEALREERVRLVGIETSSSEFVEMAEVNRQLLAERAALLSTPRAPVVVRSEPPSSPRLPEISDSGKNQDGLDEPAAGFKDCPDCAERIREGARKCRFCGIRFDAAVAGSPAKGVD